MTRKRDDHPLADRRRFLAALAATSASAVAGCNGRTDSEATTLTTTETGTTPTTTTQATETTTAGTTEASAAVRIADVSVSPSRVGQYRPATAAVTLANDGEERIDGVMMLLADDQRVGVSDFDVATGGNDATTVEFERGRVGSHELRVVVRADGDTLAEATTTFEVEQSPEHHVSVDGTELVCGDGTVYFGGASLANAFYPETIGIGGVGMRPAFDALAARGIDSVRVWGFAPSWAEMDSMPEPYTYNDEWFEYFDRVVAEAKKRDIRLFVPLVNGNPAYGPVTEEDLSVNVPQFVRWADDAQSRNDFFDSDECMKMYKDWVETLITHENHLTGVEYRDDPTIAMWELGNEIQRSKPRIGESIRPWIEEAGAFVKDLDDRTLLTTGSYGHQGRNAFVDEASADPIDVVSIHYYPGPEHYDMPEDAVLDTLESTVTTVHEDVGKPLYVGEYNWGVEPEDSAPYEERADWLGRLHGVMRDRDVAATNLWTVGVAERPTSYHKAATIYAPSEETSLDVFERHAAAMREKSTSSCVGSDGG